VIAYAKHPLSRGDKLKLREGGYKILDLRFKPRILAKGDKVFPEPIEQVKKTVKRPVKKLKSK